MDQPLRHGQLRFRVHSRRMVDSSDSVLAPILAKKMTILLRAISAADAAMNGRVSNDYYINRLFSSSPTVEIEERKKPKIRKSVTSGIDNFELCVTAIFNGRFDRAASFGRCAHYVPQLAAGADREYGYGELWFPGDRPVRVDALMEEQGRAATIPPSVLQEPELPRRWFAGVTEGGFVGHLLEVDLRGAIPSCKLVLSAGGKEIDCIFSEADLEPIRAHLKKRVRIAGRVRYDGKSGFPRRIEVRSIEQTRENPEISRWAGAFTPFDREEWEPA